MGRCCTGLISSKDRYPSDLLDSSCDHAKVSLAMMVSMNGRQTIMDRLVRPLLLPPRVQKCKRHRFVNVILWGYKFAFSRNGLGEEKFDTVPRMRLLLRCPWLLSALYFFVVILLYTAFTANSVLISYPQLLSHVDLVDMR